MNGMWGWVPAFSKEIICENFQNYITQRRVLKLLYHKMQKFHVKLLGTIINVVIQQNFSIAEIARSVCLLFVFSPALCKTPSLPFFLSTDFLPSLLLARMNHGKYCLVIYPVICVVNSGKFPILHLHPSGELR